MDFKKVYPAPFKTDGVYVWSSPGADGFETMALMLYESLDEQGEAILNRIVQLLNGDAKPNKPQLLSYSAPEILLNGEPFLVVRGWGYLQTATKTNAEAAKIQDDFAAWVIDKLTMKE